MNVGDDGRKAEKAAFIAFCAISASVLGLLAVCDPSKGPLRGVELCPLHAVAGLNCAGCGTTRAVHELLNGRILQAFAYNPFTMLLSPFVAYLAASWGLHAFTGKALPLPKRKLALALALIVAMFAFSIARNIPAEPFSRLAPHAIQTKETATEHAR